MLCPVLIWNEVIDRYFCQNIIKFGGVILGMKNLKIGLLGIGALGFIGGVALQDMMTVVGSVLFTCVVALVVFGGGD